MDVLPTPPLRPLEPSLPAGAGKDPRATALEFEAMTLAELLRPMFEALDSDALGMGGAGERMFRPMLVEQYARTMAEAGGIGLADAVLREMLALQEAAGAPTGEREDP